MILRSRRCQRRKNRARLRRSGNGVGAHGRPWQQTTSQEGTSDRGTARSSQLAEAAGAIDVAPQTLNRWLSEPEFSRQYRAARRAEYRQSMGRLAQGATAAVKSALQIMYRGKKAATRFKAAKFVIHSGKGLCRCAVFGMAGPGA